MKRAMQWMPISEKAGAAWGVDPQLITAIIAIESGGNPAVVSKSGAVGLMQLKPSTSGRDVYRRMGWRGEPSVSELKNPERNISMGAAYLSILENGPLAGIKDPQVMRYAVVVSYANGAGALLRTFSSNRQDAIEEINDLDADEFFEHVVKNTRHRRRRAISGNPESAGRHVIPRLASGSLPEATSSEIVAHGGYNAALCSPVTVAGAIAAGNILAVADIVGVNLHISAFQRWRPDAEVGPHHGVHQRDRRQPRGVGIIRPLFTDVADAGANGDPRRELIARPEGGHLIRGQLRRVIVGPVFGVLETQTIPGIRGDSTQLRGDLVVRFQLNALGMDLTRRNIGGGGDVRVASGDILCVRS